MMNPHVLVLSDALPEIIAAAGFSDVVLRCRRSGAKNHISLQYEFCTVVMLRQADTQ